ncbi:hypothetical protein AURDEDRAFT_119187 [Auricularia subglabra TFB-10046 SS5]|nr:hypothetical protein AURDEDRAFT_119187 [Auricularia subglabra TFB-10046 SS5]
MFAPSDSALHNNGVVTLYSMIGLLCQTLFLVEGAFAVVMPLSVYILKKRGHHTRFKWLRDCTCFMFFLSSAYWIASVATVVLGIHSFFISPSISLQNKLNVVSSLRSSVVLINFVVTDGVVVWRAWVLCRADYCKRLYLLLLLLFLTAISSASTIILRIATIVVRANEDFIPSPPSKLDLAVDYTHVSSLLWTFVTNVMATALVAAKAWFVQHLQLRIAYPKQEASPTGQGSPERRLDRRMWGQITRSSCACCRLWYPILLFEPMVSLEMTVEDATTGCALHESDMLSLPGALSASVRMQPEAYPTETGPRDSGTWTDRVPVVQMVNHGDAIALSTPSEVSSQTAIEKQHL